MEDVVSNFHDEVGVKNRPSLAGQNTNDKVRSNLVRTGKIVISDALYGILSGPIISQTFSESHSLCEIRSCWHH